MKDNRKQKRKLNRREFISSTAALATFSIVPRHVLAGSGQPAPSDKLNIAGIGVGGQGAIDVEDAAYNNNVYALCDVDESQAADTFLKYPQAKLYKDFRQMLDREQRNIDAVTIATPDHMHATAALWAMERGMNVYLEAPLAQSIWETRMLTEAGARYNVATQMGNRGYSSEAIRIAAEVIWNGDIGQVTEVHAWDNGGFAQGITEWPAEEPVPEYVQWDLWLGRAAQHNYSYSICPHQWRGFQEFGTGILGDRGIHILGPAHWVLKLGNPEAVECFRVDGRNDVSYASGTAIKYEFAARQDMPAISVFWYGGNYAFNTEAEEETEAESEGDTASQSEQAPQGARGAQGGYNPFAGFGGARGGRGGGAALPYTPPGLNAQDVSRFNQVFVGTKGYLCTGGNGDSITFFPKNSLMGYTVPRPTLERSPGHMDDWLLACKSPDRSTCSNFIISGPYTEWVLLGNIAEKFDGRLEWDAEKMLFSNNEKANEYIRPQFRQGWEIKAF